MLVVFVCAAVAGLAIATYLAPIVTVVLLVAASLGALVTAVLWRHPEFGLIGMIFLTAGLVPPAVSRIAVGPISFGSADVILLVMVVLSVLGALLHGSLNFHPWSISTPILILGGLGAQSAFYALLYQGVQPALVLGEFRPILYFSGAAMVVALALRRQQQLIILLGGLFFVADIVAGAIILQQFARQLIVAAPPEGLWQVNIVTQLGGGIGSARVVPPAHVLVYFMANIAFCLAASTLRAPRLRALFALQFIILAAALLITYTRAQWVASAIALLLVLALLPYDVKRNMAGQMKVFMPVAGVSAVLLLAGPLSSAGIGQALIHRVASVFTPEETLDSASLEWRSFEVKAVTQTISEYPWLGVGFGNVYRNITLVQGEASGWLWRLDGSQGQLTRFVHNAYLYLTVKAGIPALAAYFWFVGALVLFGLLVYHHIPDGWFRVTILGSICSFIGLLEWLNFQPHLMLVNSMAISGVMAGVVIAGVRLYVRKESPVNDGTVQLTGGGA